METYSHRQPLARWIAGLLACTGALFVLLTFLYPENPVVPGLPAFILAFILAIWWMVSVLITRVDASGVSWSFTWGWPGGRIPFERIERAERTQLNLLERGSAGLHWTIWHGWLWNVAGAEAVEIYTRGGSRLTLGTDDPQGLLQAIERFRRGAP